MDIRIDPQSLQNELTLAANLIENKATIPVLSNLLLKAQDNRIEIAATDLEVTLRSSFPAEVIEDGGITVPAKKFSAIVKAFADNGGQLSLKTTEEGRLHLQPVGQQQEYFLQTLPEEDYPTLLVPGDGVSVTIPTELLKRSISEVLVSVGLEDSRFSIRGALLILQTGKLAMVSTDSHRLTYTARECDIALEDEVRVLVPRKTLTEFLKLDHDGDGVEVSFTDSHIFIKVGDKLLYSRLMDSVFPDFQKVLPEELGKKAVFDRKLLKERIKRVAMVAEHRTRGVTMNFDPSGGVEIQVRNRETGDEGMEYISCESYEGEALSIVFNVDNVIDFLSSCEDDRVMLEMKEADSQVLFLPVRDEDDGSVHKHVVMPLDFD